MGDKRGQVFSGEIKKYFEEKQMGSIKLDAGGDVHFYLSACGGGKPIVGDKCTFTIFRKDNGKKTAKNIQLKSEANKALPTSQNTVANQPNNAPKNSHTHPAKNHNNPYTFLPTDTSLAVTDSPVWHDGKQADLLTGKLSITLTALTPLLVGNQHYNDGSKQNNIVPLRLPDGRVALQGSSLNGMVRHSLGALLSAPMERVAERVFSYRPNTGFIRQNTEPKYSSLPAVIQGWDENGSLKVKIFPALEAVYFSFKNFEDQYKKDRAKLTPSNEWPQPGPVDLKNSAINIKGIKRYIENKENVTLENWYVFHYLPGVDAIGALNEKAEKRAKLHNFVATSAKDYEAIKQETEIDADVIKQYLASLKQQADDEVGQLVDHPIINKQESNKKEKLKQKIKRSLGKQIVLWRNQSPLLKYQLIFVEVDNDTRQIKSFGHNFLYRWRYADSVRLHNDEVRDYLKPLACEQFSEHNDAPEQLSGARLFCGYASATTTDTTANEGSDNIGKGLYQRLKGRIGCNFAVEYWQDNKPPKDEDRFLSTHLKNKFVIPLKILGKPRPSAVEHYLRQPINGIELKKARNGDQAGLQTYGDLKGVDTPAELAGRKFYRHQPKAATQPDCYMDANAEIKQASLARYVSKPNSQFRFTFNYADLRPWELGALLFALAPNVYYTPLINGLIAKAPNTESLQTLKAKLDSIDTLATHKKQHAFAHKLGLAKPLGFGSVLLKIDKHEQFVAGSITALADVKEPAFMVCKDDKSYLKAFAGKLVQTAGTNLDGLAKHLEYWFAVHQYAGLTQFSYPIVKGEIYNYHTTIRRNHMKNRRQKATGNANTLETHVLHPVTLANS